MNDNSSKRSFGFGLLFLICLVIGIVGGYCCHDAIAEVMRTIIPQPPNPC